MKVRLCNDCVYSPDDLGANYDQHADLLCCGRCPDQGLLHTAEGPFFRDVVTQIKRTTFYKRGGRLEPQVASTLPA